MQLQRLLLTCIALCAATLLTRCGGDIVGKVKGYTYVDDGLPFVKPKSDWWGNSTERPYHVFLCLDGGGLKGIVPTMVMIELEKQIKIHIITHLDDYDVYDVPEGMTKEDYNFNTVKDFHIHLADFFDGISGISAGSWITSYLVTKGGFGASESVFRQSSIVNKYGSLKAGSLDGLRIFFLEYGTRIYPPGGLPYTIKPRGYFQLPGLGLKGVTEPQYTPDGLEWVLKVFIGDSKLSEVATSMLVVTFDLYRLSAVQFIADYLDEDAAEHKPVIYTGVSVSERNSNSGLVADNDSPSGSGDNKKKLKKMMDVEPIPVEMVRPGELEASKIGMEKLEDLDYHVRDIVRASSAFPMVHPSKLVKPLNDITYYFDMIDGALVGNNPTMPTFAWALSHDSIKGADKVAFLSLGTGFLKGSYEELGDAGFLQWQGPIVDLLMSSTPEYIHSVMDYIFFSNLNQGSMTFQPYQLLRIQLIAEADDPQLAPIIGALAQSKEQLQVLETEARLLAARYSDTLHHFVESFVCNRTKHDTSPEPKVKEPAPKMNLGLNWVTSN